MDTRRFSGLRGRMMTLTMVMRDDRLKTLIALMGRLVQKQYMDDSLFEKSRNQFRVPCAQVRVQ